LSPPPDRRGKSGLKKKAASQKNQQKRWEESNAKTRKGGAGKGGVQTNGDAEAKGSERRCQILTRGKQASPEAPAGVEVRLIATAPAQDD